MEKEFDKDNTETEICINYLFGLGSILLQFKSLLRHFYTRIH